MRLGSNGDLGNYGREDATEGLCAGEEVVQGGVEDVGNVTVRDSDTVEEAKDDENEV